MVMASSERVMRGKMLRLDAGLKQLNRVTVAKAITTIEKPFWFKSIIIIFLNQNLRFQSAYNKIWYNANNLIILKYILIWLLIWTFNNLNFWKFTLVVFLLLLVVRIQLHRCLWFQLSIRSSFYTRSRTAPLSSISIKILIRNVSISLFLFFF